MKTWRLGESRRRMISRRVKKSAVEDMTSSELVSASWVTRTSPFKDMPTETPALERFWEPVRDVLGLPADCTAPVTSAFRVVATFSALPCSSETHMDLPGLFFAHFNVEPANHRPNAPVHNWR